MKTVTHLVKAVLLGLLCWLLAGCGAPPAIRQSQVMAGNPGKTASLQFIYRNVAMTTVSSDGDGSIIAADTGFSRFGELLAQQAEPAFARHKVTVTETKVLHDNERPALDPAAHGAMPPVLVIAPSSGKTRSNGRATSTSHVFDACLMELASRRALWTATIDTSTWSGHDIVLKHWQKTLYDAAYAEQLLKAVADQMKRDGII
jgi:hypothetical protein